MANHTQCTNSRNRILHGASKMQWKTSKSRTLQIEATFNVEEIHVQSRNESIRKGSNNAQYDIAEKGFYKVIASCTAKAGFKNVNAIGNLIRAGAGYRKVNVTCNVKNTKNRIL